MLKASEINYSLQTVCPNQKIMILYRNIRWGINCFLFAFFFCIITVEHNHQRDVDRLEAAHKSGCLIYKSITSLIATKPAAEKSENVAEQTVPPVRGIEISDLIVLNKCEGVV